MKIKEIPGFPLYKADDSGNIYGPRIGIRKMMLNQCGYYYITLTKDGKHITRSVHRLIAETFLDDWDSNLEVNHKDFDKLNNSVNNLEMVTSGMNKLHAQIGNRLVVGEMNHRTKLSEKDVIFIRENYPKISANELSVMFKVGRRCIYKIINREYWKYI